MSHNMKVPSFGLSFATKLSATFKYNLRLSYRRVIVNQNNPSPFILTKNEILYGTPKALEG